MLTSAKAIFHTSGGLSYHLTARRHLPTWQAYHKRLAQWLKEWTPPSERLILFAPSGGYSLPPEFLQRFSHITAVDPDPLARLVFSWRHRQQLRRLRWNFDSSLLVDLRRPLLSTRSEKFWEKNSQAAVLFCNVLGQLPWIEKNHDDHMHIESDLWRNFRWNLRSQPWASYHDVISLEGPAQWTQEGLDKNSSLQQFALQHLRDSQLLEVRDHQTWSLGLPKPRQATWWSVRPNQQNLIAFLRSDQLGTSLHKGRPDHSHQIQGTSNQNQIAS